MVDANEKKIITAPHIILCEGLDDESFFRHFANSIVDDPTIVQFQVMSYGGKDGLEIFLRNFHLMPNFKSVKSLMIVRDSDQDMENAEKSITNALRRADYTVPSMLCELAPPEENKRHPRTAYVLLPGILTASKGCLEDLCLDILRNPSDLRMGIAQNAVNELVTAAEQSKDLRLTNPTKNKLYTYFSLTNNLLGCTVGAAVQRKVFDFDSQRLEPLRKLLIEILELG